MLFTLCTVVLLPLHCVLLLCCNTLYTFALLSLHCVLLHCCAGSGGLIPVIPFRVLPHLAIFTTCPKIVHRNSSPLMIHRHLDFHLDGEENTFWLWKVCFKTRSLTLDMFNLLQVLFMVIRSDYWMNWRHIPSCNCFTPFYKQGVTAKMHICCTSRDTKWLKPYKNAIQKTKCIFHPLYIL